MLKPKYFGPYKVRKVLPHGRYEVRKVGEHKGRGHTCTVAEYMKRWAQAADSYSGISFEPNDESGGPNVGSEGGKKCDPTICNPLP